MEDNKNLDYKEDQDEGKKMPADFFDYYADFVKLNQRKGNRHLAKVLILLKNLPVKIISRLWKLTRLFANDLEDIYLIVLMAKRQQIISAGSSRF
jgi:hypothetical protein